MMPTYKLALLIAVLWGGNISGLGADDWPMLGRDGTRNAASPEQNPPTFWQIEGVPTKFDEKGRGIEEAVESKNVKWKAELGSSTFGTPVVADGLVWIGTNGHDRSGVLRCFRESDGELLYEFESPYGGWGNDTAWGGIGCSPLVEGDRLWFTTNQYVVVCLDIEPLRTGGGDPQVLWTLDPREQLGVFPRTRLMGPPRTCSIAASFGDRIYVFTGNGVDSSWVNIPAPEAPSLLCLDKNSGKVLWQDNSPGEYILMGQLASPLVTEIDERGQVIVPQGDGWVRSFDALTGELIWKFDMNYKESKWIWNAGRGTRNELLATPVFSEGRVYLASGQYVEHGEGPGRLVCIAPTRTGDISSELAVDADGNRLPQRRIQAVDPAQGERAIANPNSGLIWEYAQQDSDGNGEIDFEETFNRTLGSVAIKDGLLFAADFSGLVHCLDAATGKVHWTHNCFSSVWVSPLIVDDKVYVADEDGVVAIFRLTAETHEPLRQISFPGSIYASPIFANGTLYVADRHTLFAIADENPTAKTISQAAPGVDKAPPAGRPRTGVNRAPDAVFVPTPQDVVEQMLKLASVKKQDVVYDLGSGDGRIVIAAAKTYGVQTVGVEIDPELIKLSQQRVQESQLADLVTIRHEDMFQVDLSQADVVAVFLYPRLLERLRPQFAKMKPGSRIVSHQFPMPDVEPNQVLTLESTETGDRHTLYLWTTPLKAAPPKPK